MYFRNQVLFHIPTKKMVKFLAVGARGIHVRTAAGKIKVVKYGSDLSHFYNKEGAIYTGSKMNFKLMEVVLFDGNEFKDVFMIKNDTFRNANLVQKQLNKLQFEIGQEQIRLQKRIQMAINFEKVGENAMRADTQNRFSMAKAKGGK